jgi:hypothetical protein
VEISRAEDLVLSRQFIFGQNIFTNTINTTRALGIEENYKACCDDERCGTVES